MSATTNEGVEALQRLVLHSPVRLDLLNLAGPQTAAPDLASTSGSSSSIRHLYIACPRHLFFY